MLSHLKVKKNGEIFIQAASGDHQGIVRRRAARIALRENRPVNYQLINESEYVFLHVDEASQIMTPKAWIEELRDNLSDPLSPEDLRQLTPNIRKLIVKELKKQRVEFHRKCLSIDREIREITKKIDV